MKTICTPVTDNSREEPKSVPLPAADLRDHFAGMALQGFMAGGFVQIIAHDAETEEEALSDMVSDIWKIADAMMEAREK